MAQKVKTPKNVEPKKHYVDPTQTWWGKTVVWIIVFGMIGLVVLSFVLALVAGNA
jgi:hypothetical protein